MRREAGAHLWDAAEASRLVHEFSRGFTESSFNADIVIRSAIERQLEILGEALKRLRRDDEATASLVPDIDRIIGMRNILAHEYGSIDYEIVWRAVTTSIPSLIPVLDELVDEARGVSGL